MTKIARVTSWVLQVPFQYPLLDEESPKTKLYVEVETDDGIKSHLLSNWPVPFAMREIINREIAPAIIGMNVRHIEAVQERMLWSVASKWHTGVYACSASLIDVALWDIKGQLTGWPVWQLLGGARQTVPAYITFGIPTYSTEQLIEAAKRLMSQGLTSLKMVVGVPQRGNGDFYARPSDDVVDYDVSRVKALREAVGPDVELMMDANKNLTYTQALRLARMVEPYNLVWFEDPILNADPLLMAKLRQRTTTPIAAGSSGTYTLNAFRELLLHDSVDYLQPNVRDIGGFTGGLKAAGIAQAFNVPLSMGGRGPHMNAHLHAGVPHGGRVEVPYDEWKVLTMLFDGVSEPANNSVTLSDRPGLGITPKEGIVKEYAVD